MIYLTDHRRGRLLALDSLDPGAGFGALAPDPATTGILRGPGGTGLDPTGQVVITDSGNNRLVILDPATGASSALQPAAGGIGQLNSPQGVAVTPAGEFTVADTGNHRVVFGGLLSAPVWSAFGTPGTGASQFVAPTSVLLDADGRTLVADPGANRLVRFDEPDGTGWTVLPLPAGARPPRPYALAAGPDDGILVTDLANARVLLLAADDSVTVLIDGAPIAPVGVGMLGGDIVVAEAGANRVARYTLDAGAWVETQHLFGVPGPLGGPEFASLTGLTTQE